MGKVPSDRPDLAVCTPILVKNWPEHMATRAVTGPTVARERREAGSGPSPHGLEAADEQETAGAHATRANETMVMGLCGVTGVYMV